MKDFSFAQEFESLVPSLPFSRPRFIVTALGAGFALSVQPVMAQTTIVTDMIGLTAGEIKVPVNGGEMPAYRAQPATGSHFPVILVVQESFGVHEHIKDICRRLAKQAFLAIAPELYARQGDTQAYTNVQELISGLVSKVTDAQVMSDLDACVALAKVHSGDIARLGITGFCWGGRIVWLYAAHNPQIKAGIAWYGRIVSAVNEITTKYPIDVVSQLHGPVLRLYGGKNQGTPLETLEKMRQMLADSANPASKASTIHVYENAPHAFHADY